MQMLYVIIFMDHTIALVKRAIMEMAKTAEVRPPGFSSFPFLLLGESALRILPSSGAHQMEPASPPYKPLESTLSRVDL